MKRPLIALVTPGFAEGGGVATVAAFLARTIRASGRYDARMVSLAMAARDPASLSLTRPSSWARGAAVVEMTVGAETVVHVGAEGGELEVRRYQPRRALDRVLADCDLVQVVAGAPCWAHAVSTCGKPVVLQAASLVDVERRARDAAPRGVLGQWRRVMTGAAARLDARALREVDAVLVENDWMLRHVGKAVDPARTSVGLAPPGVDTCLYHPRAAEPGTGERPYILCVGRLSDPRKNTGLLLDAYLRLRARGEDAPRLVLAGLSAPPARFWNQVSESGAEDDVEYVGPQDASALAALYRNAAFFVLSSDEEGFGMVLLEAMASGTPVIATRCGGPEAFVTDGTDGFLVDRGDVSAMTQRMEQLCDQDGLARTMGRSARASVEVRYAEAKVGQAFLAVYDKILGVS